MSGVNATLVLGGTRSGKSRYAEGLLGDGTAVRYLATGRRIPGDAEWDARIAAHTGRRPPEWTTEEITSGPGLAAALATGGPVLVDDLATWLTGVLDDAAAWERTGPLPEVDDAVDGLVAAVAAAPGPLVLVSAETGLGVVPETRSGRLFRDRLGELNATLAAVCEETVLVVAGRPLRLPASGLPGTAGPASPATAPAAPSAAPAPATGATEPAPGAVAADGPASPVAPAATTPVSRAGRPVMGVPVRADAPAEEQDGVASGIVGPDDGIAGPGGDVAGTPAGVPGTVDPSTPGPGTPDPGTSAPRTSGTGTSAPGTPGTGGPGSAGTEPIPAQPPTDAPASAAPAAVSGAPAPTPAPSPTPAPTPAPDPAEGDEPIVPAAVGRPDLRTRREAVALVEGLAAPTGGLGRLGELGVWLASCQTECPPRPPLDARVVLLAADHGIAALGVSAYPPEVSATRATAAAAGRLPVAVAARAAGAAVRTVDVGLAAGADGTESGYVVTRGTGRIDREDALTPEQTEAAWRTGRRLADSEIDAGADVLVPATLAVGVTTPAATLVAALTGAEPVAVVGRASGIDDRAWMRKAVAIRDALRRARPHVRDPLALLRTVGGTDLVVLAGFLARAAERKVPAVLDGVAVGAAALLAEELAPGAKDWWVAAQPSTDPAGTLVLEHLSLTPVLDLAVRTEDGTAAVTVLPLLVTAARLLAETGSAEATAVVPGEPAATVAPGGTTAGAGR